MHFRLILAASAGLAGCAAPAPINTAASQPVMLHWSCPKEGTIVYGQYQSPAGAQTTFSRTYAGADEKTPDVCLRASGSKYLFDQWNLATFRVTSAEDEQLHNSLSALMQGKSDSAHFVTRGDGGAQFTKFYRITGTDDVNIDGHIINAVRVHQDSTNASNGRQQFGDLLYDPASNVIVQSEYHTASSPAAETYRITHLDVPITVNQQLLDTDTGSYKNKETGSIVSVQRERAHLVISRTSGGSQREYPRTKYDFYYADHGIQTDSFLTDPRGLVAQIIHHSEGKPDEVFDRINANMAQN